MKGTFYCFLSAFKEVIEHVFFAAGYKAIVVVLLLLRGSKLTIFFPHEQNPVTLSNDGPATQILLTEQGSSAANAPSVGEMIQNNSDTVLSEALASTGQTTIPKVPETALLDERSLLACIVRTIPAAGRIRISSTVSVLWV